MVVLPSTLEQTNVSAFLDREVATAGCLMAEAETVITLLEERRAALISAAVTGKIDVRGLASAPAEAATAEAA